MSKTRRRHGCGSFTMGDQQVLAVVGSASDNNRDSVEFLVPGDKDPKWIKGKLPQVKR